MNIFIRQTEQIDRLIDVAKEEAQSNPELYSAKVALLALLGYAVIFGGPLMLVSILGGIGWAVAANTSVLSLLISNKMMIGLLAMIYVLIRALWIKLDSPGGYELKAEEYPELHKEISLLTRILRAPNIHQVMLTAEYDAVIVQTPRLGVFGWNKNTLYLGLELLMSMTPSQARAVIAHELGHLSGKHSRFSGWVYRIRLNWHRIMEGLAHQQHIGAELLRRFFDWYSPTFAAYSFALARANEYSADNIAAQLTTNRDAADALVYSHVIHDLLNEYYWQPFLKQAEEIEQPTGSPYSQLLAFLTSNRFDSKAVFSKVSKALTATTGLYDTHPALKDRLRALDCEPKIAHEPIIISAAELWFDKALPNIIKDFDDEWVWRNAATWKGHFMDRQKTRAELEALQAKPVQDLNPDELWQLAVLTEKLAPEEDCLPLYEQYSNLRPNDADADFAVGRLLLARNNETGVDKLTAAMGKQPHLKLNAYERLIQFYQQRDDQHAALFWQEQAEYLIDINKAAEAERNIIMSGDRFIMPDRNMDIHSQFALRLINIKGLKKAWLAEKHMRYYPQSKCFVLIFEKGFFDSEHKVSGLIASQLDPKLNCFVIGKNGTDADIAKQAIKASIELF